VRRLLRKSLLTLLVLLLLVIPLLAGLLLVIPLLAGCANDPLPEVYTGNLLSGSNDIYTVGSADYPYSEGWFNELHLSGPTTLTDGGQVWLEFRPSLDFSSVRANGKPTWVTRGLFGGFSLPVFSADDEELYFEMCTPGRWAGTAWTYLQDVGDEPGQPGEFGGLLYIPSEVTDEVYVYDGDTFSLSGAVGDRPLMALEFDGNLYVSCYGDDSIWVFDGATWSLSGVVGDGPVGLAEFDNNLYVACLADDEVWRLSGGVWAVDPALGAGGVAGAVGDQPEWMAAYDGDLYVGCGGVDDDVWIRNAGTWAKDDDVGGQPQVFHEHDGDLYLNCEDDDDAWVKSAGTWAVATNVQTYLGNAPIGLEEYDGDLYSACMDSVWADISDFWNPNSAFSEVTADEPMFLQEYNGLLYCVCKDGNSVWVYIGKTVYAHIHCWISLAQNEATDAFRLEVSSSEFDPGVDIVPATSDDFVVEVTTGTANQYQSYDILIPVDGTNLSTDYAWAGRLRRIASSHEMAGEVVIEHIGLVFKCDTLGGTEP